MNNIRVLFFAVLVGFSSAESMAYTVKSNKAMAPKRSFADDGIGGKLVITPGAGFNILGTTLLVKYNLRDIYYGFDANKGKSSAMYNFSMDYGIAEKISVGFAYGFQTATITINDGAASGWIDTWTRNHFSVRADYYFVAEQHNFFYGGIKIGYNVFGLKTTAKGYTAEQYKNRINVHPNPFSAQIHIGYTHYFKSRIGANIEAGIGYGGPFLGAIGISVKLL